MHYVYIHGAMQNGTTPPALLDQAAVTVSGMARHGWGFLVADRYGIESKVMSICLERHMPLLVIGTTVRPSSSVSKRYYERVRFTGNRDAQLKRYLMAKASRVVVIGDTADCRAVAAFARATRKQCEHYPRGLRTYAAKPIGSGHVWYSNLKHEWTYANWIAQHSSIVL